MRKERLKVIIFIGLLILLIVPLTSAGFADFFKRITGEATSNTTTINITIGNNPPTIDFVEPVNAENPVEALNRSFTFNFTATDIDGASNINVSTAEGRLSRAGEPTRSNLTCSDWATSGDDVNFTCIIDLTYFDENGAWTINVTVKDINDAAGVNSSTTLTYNLLTAVRLSPTAMGWPEIGRTATDTGSNTDPMTLNNTGNNVNLNINVTALDLQGNVTTTEHIFAENFTVENISEGCGAGATTMVNATKTNVTSAILQRGDNNLQNNDETSGQEQIFFCIKGVPQDISAQEYSSIALGAWTVEIITT